MTRRQIFMAQALHDVRSLPSDTAIRQVYGSLCHNLPVLIRRSGLCQAVAFLDAKAKGGSAQAPAYALLSTHLATTLSRKSAAELVGHVTATSLQEYMRDTRTALLALEFYKRFAVSLLGVESAEEAE